MADESTNGAGDSPTPEQAGGESAVNALFDQAAGEAAGGEGEGTGEDGGSPSSGTASESDDAWTPGYVPKAFRGTDGKFTGDNDAVFKSWMDNRQQVSRLQAQVAELKQGEGEDGASGVADEKQYVDEFDYAGLAAKAPNMVAAEGGRESNAVLASLLASARAAGIPKAKAHAMVSAYFEELNADAPEYKDDETLRKDAVSFLGPNSTQMMTDIKGFLTARARHAPFSKEQMGVIEGMLRSGPALSLLHNLARTTGQSTAPPSPASATQVDIEKEKEAVLRDLGLPDHEFRVKKDEILARARRVFPEGVPDA